MKIKWIIITLIIGIPQILFSQTNELLALDFERAFEKGLEYMDAGDYEKAEQIFLELDQINEEVIGVKMNLYVIEDQKGNEEKALLYLKKALEVAPNHPQLLRLLAEVTGNQTYQQKAEELANKIINVNSETYFQAFKNRDQVVNTEYARFDIRMTGEVVRVDTAKKLIYLRGDAAGESEGVACWGAALLIDELQVGDTLSFIGYSFGMGDDLTDPVIVFKRKE